MIAKRQNRKENFDFGRFKHNKSEINSLDKKPLLNNFIINKSIKNILLVLILLLITNLVVAIPETIRS